MRLIFSRKGFDSSAGGCPSPIFPDGSLYALPIPDPKSKIRYGELNHAGISIGKLVEELTRGKVRAEGGAHLDPDMHRRALPRKRGWKPLLGQTGAAQGHLRKQGVEPGDLLLYFGLFRPVEEVDGTWRFVRNTPARHILWGWMSVGEICKVDELKPGELSWARYHPHFQIGPDRANTLYIAGERLTLSDAANPLPGAGLFPKLKPDLVLTHPDSPRPSLWQLPRFMYPDAGRTPLSYHTKMERWGLEEMPRDKNTCNLQCAARGQEFVLDMDEYPDAGPWIVRMTTSPATK